MFEKINYKSIFVSFWIGVAISIAVQFQMDGLEDMSMFMTATFLGGLIGLAIGALAEIVTSILPLSIARPNMYFMISGSIGMIATAAVMFFLKTVVSGMDSGIFIKVFATAVGIVALANLLDYANYKRANRKLQYFKKSHFK